MHSFTKITIRLQNNTYTRQSTHMLMVTLKMDFGSKFKKIQIHLYFIATQYLWNNAPVEVIDNWARSYILIIIYWNRQKKNLSGKS